MAMGGGQSTTTTTQELSPEQRKLIEPVIPIAQNYLANPPKQYAGSAITPFNPLQQQAQQMTVDAANNMVPTTSAIPGQLQGIMQGFGSTIGQAQQASQQGGSQLNQLIGATGANAANTQGQIAQKNAAGGNQTNPGLNFLDSGAVLNPSSNPALQQAIQGATRPIIDNFNNNIMPGISNDAVATGGFGGSRQGIAQGLAAQGVTKQVGDVASQMMNQNYQAGLGAMTSGLNTSVAQQGTQGNLALGAGNLGQNALGTMIQGNLGGQAAKQQAIGTQQAGLGAAASTLGNEGNILNQTLAPSTTLSAVGGQQQAMQQAQLSEQVQKFINGQLIPFSTAQDVAAMAFGMPGGSTKSVSDAPGNPSAGLSGIGSILGAIPALAKASDRRIKENIVNIRKLFDGLNVYTFNYIGKVQKHIGLMADEVEILYPSCVCVNTKGFKMVRYTSIPSWMALNYRSNENACI